MNLLAAGLLVLVALAHFTAIPAHHMGLDAPLVFYVLNGFKSAALWFVIAYLAKNRAVWFVCLFGAMQEALVFGCGSLMFFGLKANLSRGELCDTATGVDLSGFFTLALIILALIVDKIRGRR